MFLLLLVIRFIKNAWLHKNMLDIAEYNPRNVKPAESPTYERWARTIAVEVDLKSPDSVEMVQNLDYLMALARIEFGWGAVSSNNLIWEVTDRPIRAIQLPYPSGAEHVTLVNPEVREYYGKEIKIIEGCGSFTDNIYFVPRSPFVSLVGMVLRNENFEYIELEYGMREVPKGVGTTPDYDKLIRAGYAQHEIDHLNGAAILDKGKLVTTKRKNLAEIIMGAFAQQHTYELNSMELIL